MKVHLVKPTVVADPNDLEEIEKTISLERDLAEWLEDESAKRRMSPSAFVSTLLEWARDENLLEGDFGDIPLLHRHRRQHQRA